GDMQAILPAPLKLFTYFFILTSCHSEEPDPSFECKYIGRRRISGTLRSGQILHCIQNDNSLRPSFCLPLWACPYGGLSLRETKRSGAKNLLKQIISTDS